MSELPDTMARLADWIEAHADEELTLERLGELAGLSPSRLQRRFTEVMGVSPAAYQREARLGRLKRGLRQGRDVAGAIYEAGFGSASRVYERLDETFGMTPARYRAGGRGEAIHFAVRETGLGHVIMAATGRGVCHVHFGADEEELEQGLHAEFPCALIRRSTAERDPRLDDWMTALRTHIDDGAPRPDLPVHVFGTALQIRTWRFLASLGDHDTCSYSNAAEAVGSPRAVRAVANACAANNIAVLVPCHRVLRKDGGTGGYRWGVDRKNALLGRARDR